MSSEDEKSAIENINTKKCPRSCCSYQVKPYPLQFPISQYRSPSGIRKAGSLIYDSHSSKVLLVQSRGLFWGPPKGSMNPGETIAECAVREVFEETGIQLDIDSLGRSIVVKSKAMYYLTDMAECDVQLQTEMHDNDANGIGWFHLDCLHEMVQSGEIAINNPCRILIRKVFGREIPFNQDDQNFVVVRRSPTRNHRGTQKEKND